MFWSKKKKSKKPAPKKAGNSADIRAQAMANVRAARENIGEETLDRIAAAMTKKQQSNTERAKNAIQDADVDRVTQELLSLLQEKD